MWRGRTALVACLPLVLFSAPATAKQSHDRLLLCSAEFGARYEYNHGLGIGNSEYQQFLKHRARLFLVMAEARARGGPVDCGDSDGVLLGLKYCFGRADLSAEQELLTLDRLTELVAKNGPDNPLPLCVEDETCISCTKLLNEIKK
jgi:hypothetical protein